MLINTSVMIAERKFFLYEQSAERAMVKSGNALDRHPLLRMQHRGGLSFAYERCPL